MSRTGAIFVTALGIIVILSGMLLVFAQSMRTESLASANRLAMSQADAIEQGAEQWVIAQVEAYAGDAVTITQTRAEALPVGNGHFWVVRPNLENDSQYDFGIADESGKININRADENQLLRFPSMTEEAAEAIVDWRDAGGAAGLDAVYSSLPESYLSKHDAFETVEELLLVMGVTNEMLYGLDRNRDGVIDDTERNAGGNALNFGSGDSATRGLIHYLTIWSIDPNTTSDGSARTSIRDLRPNRRGLNNFRNVLRTALGQERAEQIAAKVSGMRTSNIGQIYAASGMSPAELGKVWDLVTTRNGAVSGLVNINTASRDALLCLGLSDSDVDALLNMRSSADTSSIAWIFDALKSPNAAANILNSVSVRSYQYSADIVAVSGDGRAYKRVLIVVDARETPAKIVYRKDLTALGWPLPGEVRQSLRTGKGVVTGYAAPSGTGRINF